jgi:cell division protein FtsB
MFRSPLLTIALGSAAIILAVVYVRAQPRRIAVEQEAMHLEEQVGELEARGSALRQLSEYLDTRSYQEREARIRYNLQKPGETVVIIETPAPIVDESVTVEAGLWHKITQWFGILF